MARLSEIDRAKAISSHQDTLCLQRLISLPFSPALVCAAVYGGIELLPERTLVRHLLSVRMKAEKSKKKKKKEEEEKKKKNYFKLKPNSSSCSNDAAFTRSIFDLLLQWFLS